MASKFKDCNVCTFPTNASTRKEIKCPFCSFVCCKTCVRAYLVSIPDEPKCMNPECKHEWTLEFVSGVTPKSFHNKEYRNHRANVLISREKSILPETQPMVERVLEQRKREEEIRLINQEKRRIQKQICELERRVSKLRCENSRGGEKIERRQFVRACPVEECRGFLSTQWKCGLCETWVCSKCHEVKEAKDDENHTCNEDDVKTADLLRKETKSCPGCGVAIFKIEGCSQMWCIQCHTAFDWRTGKKVTGVIHNPHYYEWQRKQNGGVAPRVAGDVRCGGFPRYSVIARHLQKLGHFVVDEETQNTFRLIHRIVSHIEQVEIHYYPRTMGVLDNQDLRVKYMLRELSDDKWKRLLKQREKKQEKNHAIYQVLSMFVTINTDIFNRLLQTKEQEKIYKIFEEMCTLREYANKNLFKIYQRFENQVPCIIDTWKMGHYKKAIKKKKKEKKQEENQRVILKAKRTL